MSEYMTNDALSVVGKVVGCCCYCLVWIYKHYVYLSRLGNLGKRQIECQVRPPLLRGTAPYSSIRIWPSKETWIRFCTLRISDSLSAIKTIIAFQSTRKYLIMTILVAAVVVAVLYQISRYIYNILFHPLAGVPGPKLWAASRVPHELSYVRGRLVKDLTALHEKYGDVVRVSPTGLSLIHPDAWIDIYSRRPGQSIFPKDPARYGKWMWINGAPDIFSADEANHSRLRRLLIPAFSDIATGNQEKLVQLNVDLLVNQLRTRVHNQISKGRIDLSSWLNWATFDIIGDLAFGEPFGCMQAGEYHPWVALVFENVKAISIMTAIRQFPWIDWILQLFLSGFMARALRHHQQLTIDKVDRRLERKEGRGDFLDVILEYSGTDQKMTRDEIYSNSILLIMAGSETSAAAMAGCLYHLLMTPNVMSRLKEEIRSRFPSQKELTFEAVADLPYLTAVLHESMRMYPPQPIFTPRVAPSGGALVRGYFLPENTAVGIYNSVAYNATTNFRNPKLFDPSRWLDNPLYSNDRREVFKPFGIGPKSCIAKQLAYAEMRLIIARLLWNFDMTLCEESKDWTDQDAYWSWDRPALMVQLRESQ